jgi:methionyl-tRNA synthetase
MVEKQRKERLVRQTILNVTEEFLKKPAIYVTRKEQEKVIEAGIEFENATLIDEEKKPSVTYEFESLDDRDKARAILDAKTIRYRTGKTLVPFRLSGNAEWGVPVPNTDGLDDLTFWVWPESLWAPISFTKTYLESIGKDAADWKDWWISEDTKAYQFIGEDNVYFYGIAEMAMLMAYLGHGPKSEEDVENINFPQLVANRHLLFLNSKASSSGDIKPPMADELLDYYTKDQLRMHFLSLGLSKRSVSFNPQPFDPDANKDEADVVLKDGNLLTNVYNRLLRSCFYTTQKYFDNKIPNLEVSEEMLQLVEKTALNYEQNMYRQEFHRVISDLDSLIRKLSKYFSREMKKADDADDNDMRAQVIADSFYGAQVTLTLLHPIVPESSEKVLEYMNLNDSVWSWDYIMEPISKHMDDVENHKINTIPPKFDFFAKLESQFK